MVRVISGIVLKLYLEIYYTCVKPKATGSMSRFLHVADEKCAVLAACR